MTDHPTLSEPVATLIVDGDPRLWTVRPHPPWIVRIDGDLPTVELPPLGLDGVTEWRDVRADDRVWLATRTVSYDTGYRFATATVAKIEPDIGIDARWNSFLVTVADVEAL